MFHEVGPSHREARSSNDHPKTSVFTAKLNLPGSYATPPDPILCNCSHHRTIRPKICVSLMNASYRLYNLYDCTSLRETIYICSRWQDLILHAGEPLAPHACSELRPRLEDAIGYSHAAAGMSPYIYSCWSLIGYICRHIFREGFSLD
jgi:hypothetical protein